MCAYNRRVANNKDKLTKIGVHYKDALATFLRTPRRKKKPKKK